MGHVQPGSYDLSGRKIGTGPGESGKEPQTILTKVGTVDIGALEL